MHRLGMPEGTESSAIDELINTVFGSSGGDSGSDQGPDERPPACHTVLIIPVVDGLTLYKHLLSGAEQASSIEPLPFKLNPYLASNICKTSVASAC